MDYAEEWRRQTGFKLEEKTVELLKKRRRIVRQYEFVDSYAEAVARIAAFLNSHLRFRAPLQEEYPELMVLAWHYAHKEYGCPLKESEYESFVEALRVDVILKLTERIKGFVGMKEWYGKRRNENNPQLTKKTKQR